MAYKLNIQTKINPELTAHDWELYSDKPGVKGVAKKINAALRKAVNKKDSTPQTVSMEMRPVLSSFSNFGADDTEPRYHLAMIIRKVYGYEYD
jgi:hypothetical protein